MTKRRTVFSSEIIPETLIQWVKLQRPLPPEMQCARTFHDAAHAACERKWKGELNKLAAISTWMTTALVNYGKTRTYLEKLIKADENGMLWGYKLSRVALVTMEALAPKSPKVPKRLFEQRRSAAIKSLEKASEALTALQIDLSLRELSSHTAYQRFSKEVRDFENTESNRRSTRVRIEINRALSSGASNDQLVSIVDNGRKELLSEGVPDLYALLVSAKQKVASLPKQIADRHQPRAIFIREMYSQFDKSKVSTRIAFIAHAVKALFGAHMERRDIRKTVVDLTRGEKRFAKELGELENEYIASLEGRPIPEHMRSLFSEE